MGFGQELRVAAEERGIHLRREEVAAMAAHERLMRRWNPTVHLTSITSPRKVLDRHFLESFEALPYISEDPGLLMDIGTGNGFPALPLLILRPQLDGGLVEASAKKRAYLKELLRELGMEGRIRVHGRRIGVAEDLARLGPFDYLTLRAVGRVETIVEGAERGLAPGGRALLFLGKGGVDRVEALDLPQLQLEKTISLRGKDASFLMVLTKNK